MTPGVSYNDMVLDVKENNFLCGLHLTDKIHGVSFLDVSTGEFYVAQGDLAYIDKLMQNFHPAEVVLQRKKLHWFLDHFAEKYYTNTFDDWVFTSDFANELLNKQFGTTSLKGFGVEELTEGVIAAGAALYYLQDTQHDRTQHICTINRIEEDRYVWLDKFTMRNLELIYSPHENARTLLDVLDQTATPMGSRLLRRWIVMPLKERTAIEERLHVVDMLVRNRDLASQLLPQVRAVGDLERLICSLEAVARIKPLCEGVDDEAFRTLAEQFNPCPGIYERIGREIAEEPPVKLDKGGVIASGVNAELDELRSMAGSGKEYLMELQRQESERTGIPSLKVGFNNIFASEYVTINVDTLNKFEDGAEVDAKTSVLTLHYNYPVKVTGTGISLNGVAVTAKSNISSPVSVDIPLALAEGTRYTLRVERGAIVSTTDAAVSAPEFTLNFSTKAAELPISGQEASFITKKLGWGWNLGNHFDTSSGQDNVPNQWGYWDNATPTRELYTNLKMAGASTVRICTTWGNYQTPDTWTIKDSYMAEVRQNVEWAEAAGLNVILSQRTPVLRSVSRPPGNR